VEFQHLSDVNTEGPETFKIEKRSRPPYVHPEGHWFVQKSLSQGLILSHIHILTFSLIKTRCYYHPPFISRSRKWSLQVFRQQFSMSFSYVLHSRPI